MSLEMKMVTIIRPMPPPSGWMLTGTRLCRVLIQSVYPERCIFCGAVLPVPTPPAECVCGHCFEELPWTSRAGCRLCGKYGSSGGKLDKNGICGECTAGKRHYQLAVCPLQYTGAVRDALLNFKFHDKRRYAATFSTCIANRLSIQLKEMTSMKLFDIMISVPLHSERFKERGYNQSDEIARHLSGMLNIPYCPDALVKQRATTAQSLLSREQRLRDIHGAYAANANAGFFKGKHVLIVDDILTTGATLDECAGIVMADGAKFVVVAAAATGKA